MDKMDGIEVRRQNIQEVRNYGCVGFVKSSLECIWLKKNIV